MRDPAILATQPSQTISGQQVTLAPVTAQLKIDGMTGSVRAGGRLTNGHGGGGGARPDADAAGSNFGDEIKTFG